MKPQGLRVKITRFSSVVVANSGLFLPFLIDHVRSGSSPPILCIQKPRLKTYKIQPCNFDKQGLSGKCFSEDFVKFFRRVFLRTRLGCYVQVGSNLVTIIMLG